ncbi:MAG: DNA repair protein RecN [Ruminococcaceae bacterium]|nr:DNA repair protein RecN [Oscillospiraceae bacterium]
MLDTLHIENIAVVREADINLGRGFTVLTGETGAGKSIIIDAINLLLGSRPQRDLIRSGETAALASAVFSDIPKNLASQMTDAGVRLDEDGSLFLQRTVQTDGKASTRIGGRPVSVASQKEFIGALIAIHGQHDNQQFLRPEMHIRYLDDFAGDESLLSAYAALYHEYCDIRAKIRSLQKNEQEKARMAELLKYQIADIDSGRLKPKEEELLLQKRAKIRNAEKIAKQVKTICHALYRSEKGYSAVELIDRAVSALDAMTEIMPEAAAFSEKLSGFRYEIEDIAETVQAYADDDEGDPSLLLDKIETRLEGISKLKKKYGATVEEVLLYREKAAADLDDITLSDEKIAELKEQLAKKRKTLDAAAAELTSARKAAGETLSVRIMEELAFLDMEKVQFSVSIRPLSAVTDEDEDDAARYSANGCDSVEFLISTNPGEPLKPLEKIASGGELSRIMLAAKCVMAASEEISTMIFDEVDTGVSGKTSQKIGIKLRELGKTGCQVICVTHSAQIAALADAHLYISKHEVDGRVETTVTPLDEEGRIGELSRIIGGIEITDAIRATARELLAGGRVL